MRRTATCLLPFAYPLCVLVAWQWLAADHPGLALPTLIFPACLVAAARRPASIHVIGMVLAVLTPIALAVGFDVHTALAPPPGLECSIPASVVVVPVVLLGSLPYAGLTTAVLAGARLARGSPRDERST